MNASEQRRQDEATVDGAVNGGVPPRADVATLYADGGVVGPAPSKVGVTWAYCAVDAAGNFLGGGSGAILARDVGMETLENNFAETAACVFALEAMPDGWAGVLAGDNRNALRRCAGTGRKMGGVPGEFVLRLGRVWARLGAYTVLLLGGHPTKKDLARGHRSDGKPVSLWNRWCDEQCRNEAWKLRGK